MNTEEFTTRVEEFILNQVRSGELTIEKMAERIARHGLQTQRQFIEEMSERMGIEINEPKEWAIVGRIPDGENVTAIVLTPSKEQAIEEFTVGLYADEDKGARKRITKLHGAAVYVDGIVCGENLEVIQ